MLARLPSRPLDLTLLLATALGLAFRLRHFLTRRALWLDEAMLALNILHRSFGGLTQQPMEYGQSAPIGYVFAVKLSTLLFGDSEYAFRLFSLLVGCLALLLMAYFARRYLGGSGAAIAVALFAVGPYMVYYSAENKQYIDDVLATLILFSLLGRHIEGRIGRWDFLLLGGVGAILVWFSHPAAFVAAAVGATLFLHYLLRRERREILHVSLALLAWVVSLAATYLVHLRYLAGSELLQEFWEEAFVPSPFWANLPWFWRTWVAFFENPLGLGGIPWIALALCLLGLVSWWRSAWQFGAATALTLALALTANILHKYPLLGRMVLFAAPPAFLLLGIGVERLSAWIRSPRLSRSLSLALAAYLLFFPFTNSLEEFIHPTYYEHIRPAMAYLRRHVKEGDVIYIYHYAGPAFRFYAPKYGLEDSHYVIGEDHWGDLNGYRQEINALRGTKRLWVLFTHVREREGINEKEVILGYLNDAGERKREFRSPGTSVYLYLYDLR